MQSEVYKLSFPGMVHFGEGSAERTNFMLPADSVFSALCIEAVGIGRIDDFIDAVQKDRIRISDALPFIGDMYYIPCGDNLYPANTGSEKSFSEKDLGKRVIVKRTYIEEQSVPFAVEGFRFCDKCGLYLLVRYEEQEDAELMEELLYRLSLSGIGGQKKNGMGTFNLLHAKKDREYQNLINRLSGDYKKWTSLSVCLPKEEEMEKAMKNSEYRIIKRSGFVEGKGIRKKDCFLFRSGSVFENRFQGELLDVTNGNDHPVYRYAKPVFWGVE